MDTVEPTNERQGYRAVGPPGHAEYLRNLGSQSRWHSFAEACSNTAIGYAVSLVTWYAILFTGWYDINTTLSENLAIQGIFTVVSIARGYLIRRFFNART